MNLTMYEILEQIASDEELDICYAKLQSVNGILADRIILLKMGQQRRDECAVLAEELGHYFIGGGDTVNCKDQSYIDRIEEKALRKAIELTLDRDDILQALEAGEQIYEIAERYQLPENFIKVAIDRWLIWGWNE